MYFARTTPDVYFLFGHYSASVLSTKKHVPTGTGGQEDFAFFGAPASGSEKAGLGTSPISAEAVRGSRKVCWTKCTRTTGAATRGRSPASGLLIIMTTLALRDWCY